MPAGLAPYRVKADIGMSWVTHSAPEDRWRRFLWLLATARELWRRVPLVQGVTEPPLLWPVLLRVIWIPFVVALMYFCVRLGLLK